MFAENKENCEDNCQCSDLITDKFRINSGNSGTKRKQEDAISKNYKVKMKPKTVDFNKLSPIESPDPPKRKVLGEIQNSPSLLSPMVTRLKQSPFSSPKSTNSTNYPKKAKISKIFEDRTNFMMSGNANVRNSMINLDMQEDTRDCAFSENFKGSQIDILSNPKLDFTNAIPKPFEDDEEDKENFVPQNVANLDPEFESLHDLEDEFESQNLEKWSKYEIISTDSPNIISLGRATTRKITGKHYDFGAPIADVEASKSFNRPATSATRVLNFEEDNFEFTSPATKRISNISVKKSLKFTETPPKSVLSHEISDSSIGSMVSPCSSKRFPSESTTSMESGFISEMEEPFLDEIEVSINSPQVPDFSTLISAPIRDNFGPEKESRMKRPFQRSLSFNPEAAKARASIFSIKESPLKRSNNQNVALERGDSKRRRANCPPPQRPVLQRAFSENNASIMSALTRSIMDPDLIGDFSQPFALPLTSGDHTDLKSISCETLAGLLQGEFEESINSFQVIDCRYPYEYEGGHIKGALNMYTPDQVLTLMNKPVQPKEQNGKRSILVFHCELSLERGPNMSRFLRSSDRAKNSENYPSLDYPEVYLLHAGYRAFFKRFPDLCSPNGYTAMLAPEHKQQLRRHRSVQHPSSTVNPKRNRLRF